MKVFKDYAEVNEKIMEGYTVVAVTTGINEGETVGLYMFYYVTLGIDVVYNPECGENETVLMISEEYVKEK